MKDKELKFKHSLCLLAIFILFVSQVVNSQSNSGELAFITQSSSEILKATEPVEILPERTIQKEIEVLIPIFDPNIPKGDHAQEKASIWPELRRVEAAHFANEMKKELEATNEFGAVRIIPNLDAMGKIKDDIKRSSIESVGAVGDLYVLGKINNSDGENIDINIRVVSRDNVEWRNVNYKHRVSERSKDKNPYSPAFRQAAADIVRIFKSKSQQELERLDMLGEVLFGYTMSGDYFEPYLEINNGRVKLLRVPSYDDSMYKRARRFRIDDQLFIDDMQQTYKDLNNKTEASYRTWQQRSLSLVKKIRQAYAEAARKKAEVQAQRDKAVKSAQKERERVQNEAERIKSKAAAQKREAEERVRRAQRKADSEATTKQILTGIFSLWAASEGHHGLTQAGLEMFQQAEAEKQIVYSQTNQMLDEARRIEKAGYREADAMEEEAEIEMEQQIEEINQDLQRILSDKTLFQEADFHRQTLTTFGKSIDAEVMPHQRDFEGKVIKLTGNTAEQFVKWRNHLRKIYNEEKTPDKGL